MTDQAATPAMQVHIAHEAVLLGLTPFTSPRQYEESKRWLEVLFGYAKAGADIRAAQQQMQEAHKRFEEAQQVQQEVAGSPRKAEGNGAD